MREDVHEVDGGVELRAAAAPYQHVRSIGEDVSAAELLLPSGHRLRPVDVAAAGAAGATELVVRRRPVVTVIPTGDEIRPVGAELGEGELPDTNSVMLAAQAEAAGCEAHRFEITPDDPGEDRGGGPSGRRPVGPRDRDRRLERRPRRPHRRGGRRGRNARRARRGGPAGPPGGPRRGARRAGGTRAASRRSSPTPVLGAPGYPVSAALTFDIFAAPLLARLEGAPPPEAPAAQARLARKLASTMGMDDWVRVRLGRVGGRLVATPLPRGAGVLTSLVRADGLLVVPAKLEGHHAGEEVSGSPAPGRR